MAKGTPRIGGRTWAEIVNAIETQTTVDIWPYAGPALGYQSRTASYDAAKSGKIKTIPGQGRWRRVPTSWLRGVLGLKDARRGRRPAA